MFHAAHQKSVAVDLPARGRLRSHRSSPVRRPLRRNTVQFRPGTSGGPGRRSVGTGESLCRMGSSGGRGAAAW
ncbi:hypothetical protein EBESD8_58290 [Rhodococcus aetherivorans]|nr:hypothetical protein EBESD8_58290 [Rhodococcus aetherivorans]